LKSFIADIPLALTDCSPSIVFVGSRARRLARWLLTVDLGIESIPPKGTKRRRRSGAAFAARPNYSKPSQAWSSKTKQKCLDLLGFIRPNQDFSMGCSDSK
jgi:hypothetical protein